MKRLVVMSDEVPSSPIEPVLSSSPPTTPCPIRGEPIQLGMRPLIAPNDSGMFPILTLVWLPLQLLTIYFRYCQKQGQYQDA